MVQPYRYQYFDEGQQALVGKLIKKDYFLDKEELEFLGRVRCENMPKIGKYANAEVVKVTDCELEPCVPQGQVTYIYYIMQLKKE